MAPETWCADAFSTTPANTFSAFPVGTYTVHPDCTVSDTFGGNTHESVIVYEGRAYLIVNTQTGVISGEAHSNSQDMRRRTSLKS